MEGNNSLLDKYQYAFLIQLRHIEKDGSLAEVIIAQHRKLKVRRIQPSDLQAILEGETEEEVLLLIDGYDEYKKGLNEDIDDVIENGIGNCHIIITSRPGKHLDGIRRFMSGEVKITGLSDTNIRNCVEHFLGSKEMTVAMLQQILGESNTTKACNMMHDGAWPVNMLLHGPPWDRFYYLLKIPILLLMVCMIYKQNKSRPASKTQIIEKMIQMMISRTTLKTLGKRCEEMEDLEHLLCLLGKLAWEALQRDSMQLLIKQVNVSNN